jgi:ferrochelatase
MGIPVFFGMRNWRPFIRETMDLVREAGVERIAAIALAPQYSRLSVGLYIRRTEEAACEAGVKAEFSWARSFHDEPLLIEAFAARLRPLAGNRKILFTAHSLPEKILAEGDPYDSEARATAAAVAARARAGASRRPCKRRG